LQPAALTDDQEFIRRIYLDLIGRIPTRDESLRFFANRHPSKRSHVIESLLASGEFAKHWRENLNSLFMGGPAFGGNAEWRTWLEQALQQNKKWDEMAREILRGVPDKAGAAGAAQFLIARLSQGDSGLDLVTRDVSRFFFGVDIQCARCHKHPEVDQWKQESYWGMAAYFNRTYVVPIKGRAYLGEKASGEVQYSSRSGSQKIAPAMFLTGEKLIEPSTAAATKAKDKATAPAPPSEDPAAYLVPPETAKEKTRVPVPRFSRRARFLEVAINPRNPYFKRAAVNYVWSQLLGRGLVEPIDQMHDGNPPSHPELLAFLADDFAAHQFDLRYLIRTITHSRAYQLSSGYPARLPRPADSKFARALLRPLSMQQLGMALLLATGYYDALQASADAKTRCDPGAMRAKLESQHACTLATVVQNLGNLGETFQPGIREAFFLTNSPAFAGLVARGGLVARLASMKDDGALVQEAYLHILTRLPTSEEVEKLRSYLQRRPDRRAAACEQIVWALLTSSEFRFNH
jgi:hypothetical protein